ncbi:hypothetical protein DES30_103137 [Prauserella marina]|nr:hypothetical protein DES30_103137 [Prauserella marina]
MQVPCASRADRDRSTLGELGMSHARSLKPHGPRFGIDQIPDATRSGDFDLPPGQVVLGLN